MSARRRKRRKTGRVFTFWCRSPKNNGRVRWGRSQEVYVHSTKSGYLLFVASVAIPKLTIYQIFAILDWRAASFFWFIRAAEQYGHVSPACLSPAILMQLDPSASLTSDCSHNSAFDLHVHSVPMQYHQSTNIKTKSSFPFFHALAWERIPTSSTITHRARRSLSVNIIDVHQDLASE